MSWYVKGKEEERKKVNSEVLKCEEEDQKELAVTRGEVTPPTTPDRKRRAGILRRSPGGHAMNRARLLRFHQESEDRGLPRSRLREEIWREERTPSATSSPRLQIENYDLKNQGLASHNIA